MAILQTSDFVGKYKVSQDQFNTTILQGYINKYVPFYLAKLLGAALSAEMITDIGNGTEPTDADLKAIFDPFTEDQGCALVLSNGIKEMLLGFVYFHFMVDAKVQPNPISGTAIAEVENSRVYETVEAQTFGRYNEAVRTAKAIQYKCQNTSGKYTNFNGVRFLYTGAV